MVRRRTHLETFDSDFADDDPWSTVSRVLNVVSLDQHGGDVEDPNSNLEDDVAPERDLSGAIRALGGPFYALTEQEQFVIVQRLLIGDTYERIARLCEPPLSGPSQARKIEQRALLKLRDRLSRFRKLFAKKEDRP